MHVMGVCIPVAVQPDCTVASTGIIGLEGIVHLGWWRGSPRMWMSSEYWSCKTPVTGSISDTDSNHMWIWNLPQNVSDQTSVAGPGFLSVCTSPGSSLNVLVAAFPSISLLTSTQYVTVLSVEPIIGCENCWCTSLSCKPRYRELGPTLHDILTGNNPTFRRQLGADMYICLTDYWP